MTQNLAFASAITYHFPSILDINPTFLVFLIEKLRGTCLCFFFHSFALQFLNINIMKKFLLFFAALCCALGVSAEKTFYDVLPSGTGVYERTIVNMEYDMDAQTLSFDDTYMPSFTAYQRKYLVYFSEWKPEYKYIVNVGNGQSIVSYGSVEGGKSALVKSPHAAPDAQPYSHWFASEVVNNSNGGHVTIDLKSAIKTLQSVSSSVDFLVSVRAVYAVAPEASDVEYSIYGGIWEASFLLNSKHIFLAYNDISVSSVIVNVKNDQGIVAPENPKSVELAPNGTDAVRLGAEITVSRYVNSDVEYVWEYIDDNLGKWKELSKGVVSKDDFNSFASNRKVPFTSVSFTTDDKPLNFRYVRVTLSTDDSAVSITYDDPVEIDLGTPDAIQNVVTEKASQNGKFVRNNQLVIKRGDEYYNAQGVKVSATR